jgi:hypothetical protein
MEMPFSLDDWSVIDLLSPVNPGRKVDVGEKRIVSSKVSFGLDKRLPQASALQHLINLYRILFLCADVFFWSV